MPNQNIKEIVRHRDISPGFKYRIFKWYELGYLGCGVSGAPFIDMSPWIDVNSNQALAVKDEIDNIVSNMKLTHQPYTGAYVPEDVNGKKCQNYFVWRADQYIPHDVRSTFKGETDIASWVYDQGLAPKIWEEMGYIMKPDFEAAKDQSGHVSFGKIQRNGVWVEDTPLLKEWIKSWNIFDEMGRIVIFKNRPGESVNIHRDAAFFPNMMHQVSIQFTKDRRAFIYDEVKKEKLYYNTQAYFFNSCDNHGVDASDTEVYTMRIDGIFKPEFSEKIGLVGGWVWKPEYPSSAKIKNIKIFNPEERP